MSNSDTIWNTTVVREPMDLFDLVEQQIEPFGKTMADVIDIETDDAVTEITVYFDDDTDATIIIRRGALN